MTTEMLRFTYIGAKSNPIFLVFVCMLTYVFGRGIILLIFNTKSVQNIHSIERLILWIISLTIFFLCCKRLLSELRREVEVKIGEDSIIVKRYLRKNKIIPIDSCSVVKIIYNDKQLLGKTNTAFHDYHKFTNESTRSLIGLAYGIQIQITTKFKKYTIDNNINELYVNDLVRFIEAGIKCSQH